MLKEYPLDIWIGKWIQGGFKMKVCEKFGCLN